MTEPEDLVNALVSRLSARDLLGRHVVVTAGPTVEDLDPVRFVSNRSSGKMGFALAQRAAARGASVTLIAGPVPLPTPYGAHRVEVRSAIAMRGAIWQALGPDLSNAVALLMAAAVGDYRPAQTRAAKLKRGDQSLTLELVQNPDLLAEIGESREGSRPLLGGVAVETGTDASIVDCATDKLHRKRVDLVVANHAEDSLGRDDNRVTLVTRDGAEPRGAAPKGEVADRILDWVASRFETGE
jgi:phosphopantothenoylcysteine decarboxylase/phosphopantothenate--cysteine ligase